MASSHHANIFLLAQTRQIFLETAAASWNFVCPSNINCQEIGILTVLSVCVPFIIFCQSNAVLTSDVTAAEFFRASFLNSSILIGTLCLNEDSKTNGDDAAGTL